MSGPFRPRRSLDTGRLNPETYRLFDKVEKHYGIRIEYTFPDAQVRPNCKPWQMLLPLRDVCDFVQRGGAHEPWLMAVCAC